MGMKILWIKFVNWVKYLFRRPNKALQKGVSLCLLCLGKIKKSHISLPNATTLCAGSFYFFTIFIRVRFSSRMRSSTVFTAARISALGMRTASVAHG